MQIISSFRDYYDYVQAHYGEKDLRWIREDSMSSVNFLEKFDKRDSVGLLLFRPGNFFIHPTHQVFPVVVQYGAKRRVFWNYQVDWKDQMFDSVESFHEFAKASGALRSNVNVPKALKSLKTYVESSKIDWAFSKVKAPLAIARLYYIYRADILENPSMHQFAKFIPAEELFQEIYMKLSSDRNKELEGSELLTPMSEKEKLAQHGMDGKSFKKAKSH